MACARRRRAAKRPAGPVRAGRGSRARSDPARVGFPASRSPARSRARRGRMSAPGAAVEVDVTGIGAQVARDDLGKAWICPRHSRQQGMDFAGAQFEIGAVERARGAERLVDAAKVKKGGGCDAGKGMRGRCAGEPAFCSDFIGEHGLEGRQQGIEVGACDGGDGNGDQFSGVSPSRWRTGRRRLLAHQIGLLHARHQQFARA